MRKKLLLFILVAGLGKSFGQIGFEENNIVSGAYSTYTPQSVRAADIDGDGDLDIVVLGSSLNWYENVDGLGNFGPKKVIPADQPSSVGTALHVSDLDNDGDPDIVSSVGNKLVLLANDGAGNFTAMQSYTLGASYNTIPVVPADMDADGDTDILCFYQIGNAPFQGRLVWFENEGDGNFAEEQIITDSGAALIATSLVFADDLDGDNDMDIILGYDNYSKIAWLKNTGNEAFSAPVVISEAAAGISSVATSDMDGDGHRDIVTSSRTDNQVVWYKNLDGLGSFTDENIITSNATASRFVMVASLNAGNTADIVYTSTNEIGWFSNDGSGNFGSAQAITSEAYGVRFAILADIDGDGKDDLVSASQTDDKVAWYKNLDGNGGFGRQNVIARRIKFPNNVYTGDFDGDNDIDILASSQHDAKLAWLENVDGLGFYGKQHIVTESVSVGNIVPVAYPVDLDGDGDLDIASFQNSVLSWYENDGLGNFDTEHVINGNLLNATIIRAEDLDGDGDMDLLCGHYSSDKIAWYENLDGNGTFGAEQVITDSGGNNGSLTSLEIADMDGDGDLDFIGSSYNTATYYYENTDGLGAFEFQYMEEFDRMQEVYPADMDGDGDKDVIGVSALGGNGFEAVVWYENDGEANFTVQHDISTLTVHGRSIEAADIDGDGDLDVFTAGGHQQTSGQLAWYENDGSGVFAERIMIHETTDGTIGMSAAAADVDNDGDSDIVAAFGIFPSSTLGKVSVFENLGVLGNTIQGTVRIDSDSNGCTQNDLKGTQLMVVASNGSNTFATFTDQNGNYNIAATEGDFTTSITSALPNYFVSDPAWHAFSFSGMNHTQQADFCVAPTGQVNDVTVALYPLTAVRPGFEASYRIAYRNNGTVASSGSLQLAFDSAKMSFVSADQAVSAQTTNTVAFDYSGLNPFETGVIDVAFQAFAPPVVAIGDEITSVVSVVPASADATEADNTFELRQTVIGSYDPNDITCLEGSQVLIENADKYLHYVIRFQNTGTASAINVTIENVLDSNLDWTTLQLESMSHSGRVEIENGNNLKFIFNSINLAASTIDEPNSHGFIAYKIKPTSSVEVGDIANNAADIYFDFNPAIVTNTASTAFVDQLRVRDQQPVAFKIYPNPTSGLLTINGNAGILSASVTDINGRILKTYGFDGSASEATLDFSGLNSGMYFVKILSQNGSFAHKVIKK